MSERSQKVLKQRYEDGLTLNEIGKLHNVTKERIRQIQAKAVRMLRHPSRRPSIEKGLEAAKQEFEKKEKELKNRKKLMETEEKTGPDSPIEKLELSHRSYFALIRAGCLTVGQVISKYEKGTITFIRNLGKKSEEEIAIKIFEKTGIDVKKL